jgi:hypothetical protein
LGFSFEKYSSIFRVLALTYNQPTLLNLICEEIINWFSEGEVFYSVPPFIITDNVISSVLNKEDIKTKIRYYFLYLLIEDPRFYVIHITLLYLNYCGSFDNSVVDIVNVINDLKSVWKGFSEIHPEELEIYLSELRTIGILYLKDNGYSLRASNFHSFFEKEEDLISEIPFDNIPVPPDYGSLDQKRPIVVSHNGGPISLSPLTALEERELYACSNKCVNLIVGSKALGLSKVHDSIFLHIPNPLSEKIKISNIPIDEIKDPSRIQTGGNGKTEDNVLCQAVLRIREELGKSDFDSKQIVHLVLDNSTDQEDTYLLPFVLLSNRLMDELKNRIKNGPKVILSIPVNPNIWFGLKNDPMFKEKNYNVFKLNRWKKFTISDYFTNTLLLKNITPENIELVYNATKGFDSLIHYHLLNKLNYGINLLNTPNFAYPEDELVIKLIEFLSKSQNPMNIEEFSYKITNNGNSPEELFSSTLQKVLIAFETLVDLKVLYPANSSQTTILRYELDPIFNPKMEFDNSKEFIVSRYLEPFSGSFVHNSKRINDKPTTPTP